MGIATLSVWREILTQRSKRYWRRLPNESVLSVSACKRGRGSNRGSGAVGVALNHAIFAHHIEEIAMNILHIQSSPRGKSSNSIALTNAFIDACWSRDNWNR